MEIRRDIHLKRLIASRHNRLIKIVTGIRRSGKSYLLRVLFKNYLIDNGIKEDHIIELDFENRRNKKYRDPDALLEYIDSRIVDEEMYYILLDEIQLVSEFEDVLNSYLSIKNADVYVTGSNSRFLSKDVITEFRGRGEEIHITPLSFAEFSSAHLEMESYEALQEYLTYGGLPYVCTEPDEQKKISYLQGLFEKTYLTDIKERYRIRGVEVMDELLNVIASCIGGLTNPSKIENTFRSVKGIKLNQNTIKEYLEMLEDSFLITRCVRYDIKGRKYIDTPQKYYFEDLGLRNARIGFRQVEETHLMENLIYNELRIRGYLVDVGVVPTRVKDADGAYRRSQLEVDFVCNRGSERVYVQSAYRLPTEEKRKQEMASLLKIDDSFRKIIITEDLIKRHMDENGVEWVNVYDFLKSEEL
ncbi:ATP-binding protein [Bacteroides uniformis]|jgi:predicted AAA+ superfamily ATPase|uniref:ATP-binding protein n=1 Tax=Bacteroides uniformis TaxID=820 RepID=A0AAW6GI33_BACUN|nr:MULTISPECIES: ATP-binding protein [Bacteroidales]MCO7104644.1 ATP-binding protein [Alistipes shahii]MDC1856760.1 ATP-binding protein [Bacteroides uniformis]MDC1861183.1 ATP-binding protein [Bacteroides uniformis]MDC1874033.1 ATP-binding protein [Bacteroides uniformis]